MTTALKVTGGLGIGLLSAYILGFEPTLVTDPAIAMIMGMPTEEVTKAREYTTEAIGKAVALRETPRAVMLNAAADEYIEGGETAMLRYLYENDDTVFKTVNRMVAVLSLTAAGIFGLGAFSASNLKFTDLL